MITFTDAALNRLKEAIDPGDYVRVGVVGGGCAGLSYVLEIEEDKNSDDTIIDIDGVKICMNPFSSFTMKEVVVDYVESLYQSGFKFDNPTALKNCACGTSFKPEKGGPAPPPGCPTKIGCG